MKNRVTVFAFLVLFSFVSCQAASISLDTSILEPANVTFEIQGQYDSVRPESSSAIEVKFELAEDWHFYASGPTMLQVVPSAQEDFITFDEPIFPPPEKYTVEELNETINVFGGSFSVYLPFEVGEVELGAGQSIDVEIQVDIDGPMCSGPKCTLPTFEPLYISVTIAADAPMSEAAFEVPERGEQVSDVKSLDVAAYSLLIALPLAFLAGLILNIMPCVLPVIPLVVLNIFERAKSSKAKSVAMGLSFCIGMLSFFAALAIVNIVLRAGFGQVFQWGDHFRNPLFVAIAALLMTVLALFMFGVVTFTLPSSVSGAERKAEGLGGSFGLGFLAAILSTPCSFAILAAAFAWAQTQNLFLATFTIMVIGLGMATPYLILTSVPSLLKYLPKPGRWMELFKQSMGFVLLAIAVKMITALPDERIIGISLYALIFSYCVWMWGGWVTFSTGRIKKFIVRSIALVVIVLGGFYFLPEPAPSMIEFEEYDAAEISHAIKEQKPVLIKFTADWCLSCKFVDSTIYSKKSIADLIEEKGVLPFEGDTTLKKYRATKDLVNVYKQTGVPVSVLFMPGQSGPEVMAGLEINRLKGLLQKLPDAEKAEDPND